MPDQSGENNPFFGKTHSAKTKAKIGKKKKGSVPVNKGTKHTEDALKKMRKPRSQKGKQNIRKGLEGRWDKPENLSDCPHCGMKSVVNANYKKYHGDACWLKNKTIIGYTKEKVLVSSKDIPDLEKQGYNMPMIKDRIKVGERYQYKNMYWKLEKTA
jgi:hypothetical protein